MKTIIEQATVAKPIEYDTIDVEIFVSDDGKRKSKRKEDIEEYENKERIKKERQEKFDSIQKIIPGEKFSIYDRTYFLLNSDEFRFMLAFYCITSGDKIGSLPLHYDDGYVYQSERFYFGEDHSFAKWYSFKYCACCDESDFLDIYSEGYIAYEIEQKRKELEKFKPIYEKYMKE